MPEQDGSLTDADRALLVRALDRLIPTADAELAAGALGMLDDVEKRARREKSTRSAFIRVVEALSLDLTAHAIGGFSAMTDQEQTNSLLSVESALPRDFLLFLEVVRDVYYEDDRTPARPAVFDGEDEVFGKVTEDAGTDQATPHSSRRSDRN